jgi:hypothetical protein
MHYTAKDAVEVFARGTKGVPEMRAAAEKHFNERESSAGPNPLFGMVHFRRRKILIKIVLDGTSRLIQGMCWQYLGSIGYSCDLLTLSCSSNPGPLGLSHGEIPFP